MIGFMRMAIGGGDQDYTKVGLHLGIALLALWLGWNKKMDLRKDSKVLALVASSGMTTVAFIILFVAFLIRDLQN